jgi:hypothetical protein
MNQLAAKVSDVVTQLDIKVLYRAAKVDSSNHTLLIEDENGADQVIHMLATNQAKAYSAHEWKTAPEERYIFSDGKKWIAVDHTTGDSWTEEFETFEEALFWLANNNYTPEEVREAYNRNPEVRHATT